MECSHNVIVKRIWKGHEMFVSIFIVRYANFSSVMNLPVLIMASNVQGPGTYIDSMVAKTYWKRFIPGRIVFMKEQT